MMPELLALYYEDSVKPSIQYMYNQMQGRSPSSKLIEEASVQLNLEGTDPTDAFTFAHLNSIGVSWGQLRILTSSLPLWRTVNLVTNWEILARGPVKRELKRPALDYLRRRLQIGPGDIYRLLKTHTRLSTYDACNKIVPTLDMLQSGLRLSSAELRRLILRMPSLVGMGASAFEDRYDFFTNEGKQGTNPIFYQCLLIRRLTKLNFVFNSLTQSRHVMRRTETCRTETAVVVTVWRRLGTAPEVTLLTRRASGFEIGYR